MSTTGTEITGEEGEALRQMILAHIGGIDDLRVACEAKDFAQAERLAIEFGDELRLMEDLRWTGVPPHTAILKLTMPPEQSRRVFTRLRSVAAALSTNEERERAEVVEEDRRFRERAKRVAEACDRVLGAVSESAPQAREST